MKKEDFKNATQEDINELLIFSVKEKDYKLINYVLTTDDFSYKPDIHHQVTNENPIIYAIKENDERALLLLLNDWEQNPLCKDNETMKKLYDFSLSKEFFNIAEIIVQVNESLNKFDLFNQALGTENTEKINKYYDLMADKNEVLLASCYHGNIEIFNKVLNEPNIELKFNVDLGFSYVIQSKNVNLFNKYLEVFYNHLNWNKRNYFLEKIVNTEEKEFIKTILNHKNLVDKFELNTSTDLFDNLLKESKKNHKVKEILEYFIFEHVLRIKDINAVIAECCRNGQFSIVKYLLTNEQFDSQVDIHYNDDMFLTMACANGYIEIVDFLLTSKELRENSNIHSKNNNPLNFAFLNRQEEVIKYLLTSSKLSEKADINARGLSNFKNAKKMSDDFLKFLIIEGDLKLSNEIKKEMKKPEYINEKKWFQLKDLNFKLNEKLDNNQIKSKVNKI